MEIIATIRTESGKGIARKLRNADQLPGVLYAQATKPVALAVDGKSLRKAMKAGQFFTQKHIIQLDGKPTEVLARDVQRDVLTDQVVHIDFMHYDPSRTIRVVVPVAVTGEADSPGLKKGGVLQLVRSEIELFCRADSIPQQVTISMTGKDIGDAVKISEVTLPAGVKPTIERDFTIASVVGTRSSTMADLEASKAADA